MNINIEKEFINNIFFTCKKIDFNEFAKLNLEKLTKIASSHLIIPALYINLRNKNYLKYLPKDFAKYLKEIYTLNRDRNKILLDETNKLSALLIKNKIEHVFIKGTALLFNKLYDDIGERMIGDIDILVAEKDVEKTFKLTKANGYYPQTKTKSFHTNESKHLKRQINKNKIFAIEIHKKLFITKHILEDNEYAKGVLDRKIKKNNIYMPSLTDQFRNNIMNYQINDNGKLFLSFSYKSYYDLYCILKNSKLELNNINENKYINSYFLVGKKMGIDFLKDLLINNKKIEIMRFNLVYNFSIIYKINIILCRLYLILKFIPDQLNRFLLKKEYRKYVFNKLKKI